MFDIKTFVQRIRALQLTYDMSAREWTKAVIDTLVAMGKNQGYEVYPDKEAGMGEVLLDCVWYDVEKEPYVYKKMILGAESEWGTEENKALNTEEVIFDFYKLLDFRCESKVMIFSTYNYDEAYCTQLTNELLEILRSYETHMTGETYYLIDFSDKLNSINYSMVSITESGKIPDLKLYPTERFTNCWF